MKLEKTRMLLNKGASLNECMWQYFDESADKGIVNCFELMTAREKLLKNAKEAESKKDYAVALENHLKAIDYKHAVIDNRDCDFFEADTLKPINSKEWLLNRLQSAL